MAPKKVEDARDDVADAKAAVQKAETALAEATAAHAQAVADQRAAEKAVAPKPNPDKHVFLENEGGEPMLLEHPDAATRERRISVSGQNYEHVADGENGVWIYRQM